MDGGKFVKQEVQRAAMKRGKAVCSDDISVEMFRREGSGPFDQIT